MHEEVWKDVRGYETKYQVSNMGNVRSLNYRRSGKPGILQPALDSNGYRRAFLCKDGKCKTIKVPVLVAETFYRPREKGEVVMHLNNIREDDRLCNLKIGTQSENIKQKFRDGYEHTEKNRKAVSDSMKGTKHHSNKLSEEQVREIRSKLDFTTRVTLANEYGVTPTAIYDIEHSRTWSWLD